MAKHRKTRREKLIADQRHVVYHLENTTSEVNSNVEKKSDLKISPPPVQKTQVTSYSYVSRDLRKTAVVTAGIIIAQIILFIALNRV